MTDAADAADKPTPEPTLTRAVTLSLAIDGDDRARIWELLHASWIAVGRAANAAMRTWIACDTAETATSKRGTPTLAPLSAVVSAAAYAAARAAAPELSSSPVADVTQRVRGRYLADRWAIQRAIRKSAPTFRRPLPLSIRRKDWQLVAADDPQKPDRTAYWVRFPLGELLRDRRPCLRLIIRTGRDAALLARITAGDYDRRTLEILPPGWERKGPCRVKLVYTRPRVVRPPVAQPPSAENGQPRAAGPLHVATGAEHLLTATGGKPADPAHWSLDWLRGRIISYERWRQRHSEDCKHERRVPKSRRRVWRQDAGRHAAKHHNRVSTALQQVAAQVAGLAARRGCATILYDDSDQSWLESFPWYKLNQEIKRAAENGGLEVTFPEPAAAPADDESQSGGCPAEQSGGSVHPSTADTKPRRTRAKKGSG